MADQLLRADELDNNNNNTCGWGLLGSNFEDEAAFYHQAANSYKLAKSWELAAIAYNNLAACRLRMDSKDEAAASYADAASCYKKISSEKAISSLERVVDLFSELGTFNMAARYCKEVGELYEQGNNLEQAIEYFGRAAGLFRGEEVTTTAAQCRQKVAQLSAQLQRYTKAAETFEDIAGHSFRNDSLRYAVRGHLLNAGICHLCKGNTAASRNALEHYKEIDPSFSRTREHKLLADLAGAVDEENVENFTDILKEYDSLSPLGIWRTTMLLRVKEALKAKNVGDANLR